jgi:hypothetical protein
MADHPKDRELRAAVADALTDLDRRGGYVRSQREATNGQRDDDRDDRAAPLQFDDRGFPIPRPVPRFMGRVRRLLGDA